MPQGLLDVYIAGRKLPYGNWESEDMVRQHQEQVSGHRSPDGAQPTKGIEIPWCAALKGVVRVAEGVDLDIRQIQTCFDESSGVVLRDTAAICIKNPLDELQFTLRPLVMGPGHKIALKFTIIREPKNRNITDGPYCFRVLEPFEFPLILESAERRPDLHIKRTSILNDMKNKINEIFAQNAQGMILVRGGACAGKSTLLADLADDLKQDPGLVVVKVNAALLEYLEGKEEFSRIIDRAIVAGYVSSPGTTEAQPTETAYKYGVQSAKDWLYKQLLWESNSHKPPKKLVIMLDEMDRYALQKVPPKPSPVSETDILSDVRERILFGAVGACKIPAILIVADWDRGRVFEGSDITRRSVEVPPFTLTEAPTVGEVEKLTRMLFCDLITDSQALSNLAIDVHIATGGNPLLVKAVLSFAVKYWLQEDKIPTEGLTSHAAKDDTVGEAVRHMLFKTKPTTDKEAPRLRLTDTEVATLRQIYYKRNLNPAQRRAAENLVLRGILKPTSNSFDIRIPVVRAWLLEVLKLRDRELSASADAEK